MNVRRRSFLLGIGALTVAPRALGQAADAYPMVQRGRAFAFPRDFGAHADYRTEWWYITGWLQQPDGAPLGMQITFFRHRPRIGEGSASRFAPRQLLFAHAALADPRRGRLLHDQRAARTGFGLAEASETTTDVHLGAWSLRRDGDAYDAHIAAREFALDLRFALTQPPLLQGDAGYSRKGPEPAQASYYVSEPQLAASGTVTIGASAIVVTGRAWCDHEWSSEYLAPQGAGWDWTGINLDDGGALMLFVIRERSGAALWAGGSVRSADGTLRIFDASGVRFTTRRTWKSPRTQAVYPVETEVQAGEQRWVLQPLFDDQELDARASTGTIYWEGAVRALSDGREVGRGYLELTGYAGPLRL